jgi:hypothetical protein
MAAAVAALRRSCRDNDPAEDMGAAARAIGTAKRSADSRRGKIS